MSNCFIATATQFANAAYRSTTAAEEFYK